MPFGPGITSQVIRTGKPLRLSTHRRAAGGRAISVGGTDTPVRSACRSRPRNGSSGSSRQESVEAYAYSEADERLLSTLASSMGVAPENARLAKRSGLRRDRRTRRRTCGHQRASGQHWPASWSSSTSSVSLASASGRCSRPARSTSRSSTRPRSTFRSHMPSTRASGRPTLRRCRLDGIDVDGHRAPGARCDLRHPRRAATARPGRRRTAIRVMAGAPTSSPARRPSACSSSSR